jgi:ABC-type antimicrobial peptide transport system permease subunit
VAVVNETFAQTFFESANPVGRSFYFTSDRKTPITVVGMAKDGKYGDLRETKQPFIFCPYAQQYNPGEGGMTWYVRTAQQPQAAVATLRQTVRDADSTLSIFNVKTMEQQIDDSVFANRILSTLTAFFALLATGLAAMGLYGVMSYTVARRTREIGIRMALGARPGEVVSMVLREVMLLAAVGIAVAIPLAYPLTRVAKSMLYGIAPGNAGALTAAACVLAVTALAAGYVPAARAAHIDPLTALRHE